MSRSWSKFAFIQCKFQLTKFVRMWICCYKTLTLEVIASCVVSEVRAENMLHYNDCVCRSLRTSCVITRNDLRFIRTKLLVEQGLFHEFAFDKKGVWNTRQISNTGMLKTFEVWTPLNANANFVTSLKIHDYILDVLTCKRFV